MQENQPHQNQKSIINNKQIGSRSSIQKSNLPIQTLDSQSNSNQSITLDVSHEDSLCLKQEQITQANIEQQKSKNNFQKQPHHNTPPKVIAAPQQYEKIDLKNQEHQRIIINILQKNRPKNNIETDIMFDLIQNLPFFKNNKEVLTQSATTKELIQSLKLQFFEKNEILFSKGDIGNTFYIILSGSAYCLLELQKLEQNPKIKEEGSKKKILFNFDFTTNPTFDQEQAALKQLLPNMNMVKIFLPGESFGEIALITSQPRTATLILRQDSYLMTLNKEAYNKILGQYDQIILRDRRKFLMNFQCFKYHNYSKLLSLLHFMKIQVFNKKHVLYKEGDKPDHIYFVKQGEVEISKQYDLDQNIEEKDTSLELQQWRAQRKAQIYKLNKVKQIKDKIESLFCIQVVILGQNSCFGEEDIFLNHPKRQSTATIISSQAEIFSIEKQKLFNELHIFQTLEMFEKEFQLKFQQQQINFEKNISSAMDQRKVQILKNMMKAGVQQQTQAYSFQEQQNINSPKQNQGFSLPKIPQNKSSNFMQQDYGSEISNQKKNTEEDNLDFNSCMNSNYYQDSKNPFVNQQYFSTPKNRLNSLSNDYATYHQNQSDVKNQQQLLKGLTQKIFKVKTETSNSNQEYESSSFMKIQSSQMMSNIDQNKNFANRTSFDTFKFSTQKNQIPYQHLQKNMKPSIFDIQQDYLSQNSKEKIIFSNKNTFNSPKYLNSQQLYNTELSIQQKTDQIKYFKSSKMSNTITSLKETIRKYDDQKRESSMEFINRINKGIHEKQLQLIDLNTRSLDLKEISGELLKIFIQKHSQQQINESLQTISQQRLLSMSTTLRDSSNNRLYMKYSGILNQKKNNGSKVSSYQKIPTSNSSKSQIQNYEQTNEEISNQDKNLESSKQKGIQAPQSAKMNRKKLQVQIPESGFSDYNDTQLINYTKSSFNRQESFKNQTCQNTPKSNKSQLTKTHKKNEFQLEAPMTTTDQFKYFKQQIDFLENSDKYIEQIKKSNNSQIKLSDILQTKEQSNSPYQKQMSSKLTQKAFNDSMSLLSQEMFKGQAIKKIQMQRHHSVIITSQNSSDNISPTSSKFNKLTSNQNEGAFSNFLKNISNFSRLNSLISDDDDVVSRKSDKIQERSNSVVSMSPLRLTQRKSIYRFNDLSDLKQDQDSPQQNQKFNTSNENTENPLKIQRNQSSLDDQKKVLKHSISSFKLESTMQNGDFQKIKQNPYKYNQKQQEIDNDLLIKNIKLASNPQLTKLVSQIEKIKIQKEKEKDQDYYNIAQSLQNKVQDNQEANHIKQLSVCKDKFKENFSSLKGDRQHYKKIKEINHQQVALFKPAKLNNRGHQQSSPQIVLKTPLVLQAHQKKLSCSKQNQQNS